MPPDHTERWLRSLRRLFTPRSLRHMLAYPRQFLRPASGDASEREIWWRGKMVGRLLPVLPLRHSQDGDAFILASGPSIQGLDLTPLRDHATFAVNGSIAKLHDLGFSPQYYVVVDKDFVRTRFDYLRLATGGSTRCFFPPHLIRHICDQDPSWPGGALLHLLDPVNARHGMPSVSARSLRDHLANEPDFLLHPDLATDVSLVGFSTNLEKGSFTSGTVVHPALQVAYYLGFKRVFILGMDLTVSPQQPRFYPEGDHPRPCRLSDVFTSHIVPCMELVRELGRRSSFAVYNVSPESRLPANILPTITYEEALRMAQPARTPPTRTGG